MYNSDYECSHYELDTLKYIISYASLYISGNEIRIISLRNNNLCIYTNKQKTLHVAYAMFVRLSKGKTKKSLLVFYK